MISIVSAYYKNEEMTINFLDNLKDKIEKDVEVILVNVGSKKIKHPLIKKRIDLKKNKSFSNSMNSGIKIATGEYVIVINNDAFPINKDWINKLITLQKESGAGIVAATPDNPDISKYQHLFIEENNDYNVCKMFPAICWLIPRTTIEKVGLFDERFILGGYEDNDYCDRVRERNLKIILAKKVVIKHLLNQTLNLVGKEKSLKENYKKYLKKKEETMKIPIFIITRDRLIVLKKCIENYKKLGNVEIVIHDNNSTYMKTVEFLKDLEKNGVKVYYHPNPKNDFYDISESVSKTIEEWYKTNDSLYYVVTDPDIEFEKPNVKILKYYIEVMKTFNPIVVGPMLKIDDLPESFNAKYKTIKIQKRQFWVEDNKRIYFKGIKIQFAEIDTTFGLYKKEFRFKRQNQGIRVHEPFNARHLDWYIDTNNLSEEQEYYLKKCSKKVSTTSRRILEFYKKINFFKNIIKKLNYF